jgi:hypothetical protein
MLGKRRGWGGAKLLKNCQIIRSRGARHDASPFDQVIVAQMVTASKLEWTSGNPPTPGQSGATDLGEIDRCCRRAAPDLGPLFLSRSADDPWRTQSGAARRQFWRVLTVRRAALPRRGVTALKRKLLIVDRPLSFRFGCDIFPGTAQHGGEYCEIRLVLADEAVGASVTELCPASNSFLDGHSWHRVEKAENRRIRAWERSSRPLAADWRCWSA